MPSPRFLTVLSLATVLATLGACQPSSMPARAASSQSQPDEAPDIPDSIWQPEPGTSWQWQLVDSLDTGFDVDMYDVDLFDVSTAQIASLQADGRIVICYFSAGTLETWRPDADAFPSAVIGNRSNWPRERWFDIRATDLLAEPLEARLDLAVEKGCDGVEPDNVDGYINDTGFDLTADDQLQFNRYLANRAHERGLSIGLKNDVDQIRQLEPWFDWALNERCHELGECSRMVPFIDAGKAVFGVEYTGDPAVFCPQLNALNYDWLKKPLNLGSERFACR